MGSELFQQFIKEKLYSGNNFLILKDKKVVFSESKVILSDKIEMIDGITILYSHIR